MANRVLLFVEGATDKVLFLKILELYKVSYPKCKKVKCVVKSLDSVTNYSSKAKRILRNEVQTLQGTRDEIKMVLCSYDTDVLEFGYNPPIDWGILKPDLENIVGENRVEQIPVEKSIEDWLLTDIDGICKYLKIKNKPRKLQGKSGFEKMKNWFKLRGKVYSKGYDSENIVKHLNIAQIEKEHNKVLKPLRVALGIEKP